MQFQQAHAEARDAVHQALDVAQLTQDMSAAWLHGAPAPLALHSGAASRAQYLQRPDWGRLLNADSRLRLQTLREADHSGLPRPFDLVLVVADGLSALAVQQNAPPFLEALRHKLAVTHGRIAPLCIVEQGRVAVGDAVGEALGARAVVVLIGERPGLSSPDSMGLYLTWMPRVGLTDAARNCISNVRPAGLVVRGGGCQIGVPAGAGPQPPVIGRGFERRHRPHGHRGRAGAKQLSAGLNARFIRWAKSLRSTSSAHPCRS